MPQHIDAPPADEVRADHTSELYVITHANHVSTLGFDVCLERVRDYAADLQQSAPKVERGTVEAYSVMRGLQAALEQRFNDTGQRAVAELTPSLMGKEGWRVEVVDEEGDAPRRFIVGKSTGYIPIHLEISRRNAHGGYPARRYYHRVRQIERVR